MKVLIAYDGSRFAEAAIADLADAGLPDDTQARIFHVVERHIDPMSESMLEDACTRVQYRFRSWNVQMETATGTPAEMILKRSREWPADLIVLGTHGRGSFTRLLLGSVSTVVSRDAGCAVRVVHHKHHHREGGLRLLIGHDGSSEADAAVHEVCRRTWPAGTEVRVMSVIESLVATHADQMAGIADTVRDINVQEHEWLEYLATEAERQCRHAGLAASSIVTEGDPKESLINEARRWNADTI
ncbi:MAG TPA: universal stress protein, partial [Terriglobia bacterium]|nr:universal stress protein [Terriglobia bacterium]